MPGNLLGYLMLVAAAMIMYKVADAEGRNPFLWAFLTLIICFGSARFIPLPFINIAIGLGISYGIMFALKMREP